MKVTKNQISCNNKQKPKQTRKKTIKIQSKQTEMTQRGQKKRRKKEGNLLLIKILQGYVHNFTDQLVIRDIIAVGLNGKWIFWIDARDEALQETAIGAPIITVRAVLHALFSF